MYKTLCVENNEIPIKNVKHIKMKNLVEELKSEYDLIYINEKQITKPIRKLIEADYMILPKELNKLAINEEKNTVFIKLEAVNKLIFDNIKIIEFNNYYDEMIIAIILKQMLNRRKKFE